MDSRCYILCFFFNTVSEGLVHQLTDTKTSVILYLSSTFAIGTHKMMSDFQYKPDFYRYFNSRMKKNF